VEFHTESIEITYGCLVDSPISIGEPTIVDFDGRQLRARVEHLMRWSWLIVAGRWREMLAVRR